MCRVNATVAGGKLDAAALRDMVRFSTRKEFHETQLGPRRQWISWSEEERQTKTFGELVLLEIGKTVA